MVATVTTMVATVIGGWVTLLIALAAFVYVCGRRAAPGVAVAVLRWVAFALTVGIAVWLAPAGVADSGAFAGVLLGVPMVAGVLPLVADAIGRAVGLVTAFAAAGMLVWSLLGFGLHFVFPALMLGVAAGVEATVLRWFAFALTLGFAVALAPAGVADIGAFAGVLLGVPVAAGLLPLLAEAIGRVAAGLVTVLAAAGMLVWSLLTGPGLGLYFVFPALVLGVAAVSSVQPRSRSAVYT